MNKAKPILVTGCHRSGSTWIGKTISTSPSVDYIHEPFNGMCRLGKCSAKFPYTYMYITKENECDFYSSLKDTISFQYNVASEIKISKTPRDIARLLRDYLVFSKNRISKLQPILKDPMAVFSAEWLSQRFDMNVLISIRHPAAFVSSCKQLGWGFDFENILNQPLLIRNYLYPFEEEIKDCIANKNNELIDRLCLLWKLIYHTVKCYQTKHRNWIFLKYEDLCNNPIKTYENIFEKFNIEFSNLTRSTILQSSNYSEYKGVFQEIHSTKRNSRENISIWKQRLTKHEIAYIKEKVGNISQHFYSDDEW